MQGSFWNAVNQTSPLENDADAFLVYVYLGPLKRMQNLVRGRSELWFQSYNRVRKRSDSQIKSDKVRLFYRSDKKSDKSKIFLKIFVDGQIFS